MTPSPSDPQQESQPDRKPGGWRKLALLAAIATLLGLVYTRYGQVLTLANLAQYEEQLRGAQGDHPLLVYCGALLLYVLVTGLSLPGAAVLTLAYGWFFGVVRGVVMVSFASTAGATLALLLSRYLFRDAVQSRFGERLVAFNRALQQEGPFFLFTLRLIPVAPFFVINAVMGLTPIRPWTFWWVSQLGMLPGTAVYVYAGASVPSLGQLSQEGVGAVFSPAQLAQITTAFVLLGCFPLLVRYALRWFAGTPRSTADSNPSA